MKHGVIAARVLPLLEHENHVAAIARETGFVYNSVRHNLRRATSEGLVEITRVEPALRRNGLVAYYVLTAKGRASLEKKE
jgi:hypothetical protein